MKVKKNCDDMNAKKNDDRIEKENIRWNLLKQRNLCETNKQYSAHSYGNNNFAICLPKEAV